jgi:hypothetical protein
MLTILIPLTLHITTRFELDSYIKFIVFVHPYTRYGFDFWVDFC